METINTDIYNINLSPPPLPLFVLLKLTHKRYNAFQTYGIKMFLGKSLLNCSLQPFSEEYNLVSHSTYVIC